VNNGYRSIFAFRHQPDSSAGRPFWRPVLPLSKISELQLQIDTLKHALSIKQVTTPKPIQSFLGEEPDGHKTKNPEWKV